MKAYTDIKQSKKLTEILPGDSADMCWGIDDDTLTWNTLPYLFPWRGYTTKEYYLPCWSLAALLDILPETIEDEFAEYELEIDMTYKKPKYIRLGDCCHSDFPSWDWDNKELLDNIVEAVIWLNNNGYLRNEKLH